jgi:pimeloyl-ACP methyl ester carboxylesterase
MPAPDTATASSASVRSLARPQGATIAYHRLGGAAPGIIFLGGFRSDMTGTKALFLEDYCRQRGRAYVRFDYFGHGQSRGDFADGTIGRWRDDAIAVIDSLSEGPQILIGSSRRLDHGAGGTGATRARVRPGRHRRRPRFHR